MGEDRKDFHGEIIGSRPPASDRESFRLTRSKAGAIVGVKMNIVLFRLGQRPRGFVRPIDSLQQQAQHGPAFRAIGREAEAGVQFRHRTFGETLVR